MIFHKSIGLIRHVLLIRFFLLSIFNSAKLTEQISILHFAIRQIFYSIFSTEFYCDTRSSCTIFILDKSLSWFHYFTIIWLFPLFQIIICPDSYIHTFSYTLLIQISVCPNFMFSELTLVLIFIFSIHHLFIIFISSNLFFSGMTIWHTF